MVYNIQYTVNTVYYTIPYRVRLSGIFESVRPGRENIVVEKPSKLAVSGWRGKLQCTQYSAKCTCNNSQCTVWCTMYSLKCAQFRVCTVYSVYNVQCAQFTVRTVYRAR